MSKAFWVGVDVGKESFFAAVASGEDAVADWARLPVMTHPSFDYEDFVKRHPESPMTLLREGLMEYLAHEAEAGRVRPENVGPSGLTLVATMHSLAMFEKLGVHGGHFDDQMLKDIVRSIWQGLKP